MFQRNPMATLVQWTLSLCLVAGVAQAQANPELGEVGGTAQGGTTTPVAAGTQATWQPPAQTAPTGDAQANTDVTTDAPVGDSDHAGVVGTLGIGFFGVMDVPAMGCTGAACPDTAATANAVSAPTLGLRYWLQEDLGIEAALGFNISSSGASTTPPAGAAFDTNGPSYVAVALHGGLPLVMAHSGHFALEIIPELNFGIASGSLDDTSPANLDVTLGGMLFELGARAGAEIQFGFIGIPQLALQGTIGAHLRYEGRSATVTGAGGPTDISTSSFRFGTSVQGEPWDIFTGAITAIYYL